MYFGSFLTPKNATDCSFNSENISTELCPFLKDKLLVSTELTTVRRICLVSETFNMAVGL